MNEDKICLVGFACFFGMGLGLLMGYQLHEQTTPAAEVAQMALSTKNKVEQLEAWRDKYAKPIVIKPTKKDEEYFCVDCVTTAFCEKKKGKWVAKDTGLACE